MSLAPRHVLLVNDHLGWGNQVHGVTRLFELWARHLDPARYRASVCILRRQPELASALRAAGVPVTFLAKGRYDPRTLFSLWRLVRRERIAVLHVQGYGGTTFGRLAGLLAGVPVIVHFHDTSPYYPFPQKLADRLLGRLTHHYLAVSTTVRDWWARRCGLAPGQVQVLPNCTSLERFQPPSASRVADARRRLGLDPAATVIGTVTRLFEEKGTRFLVEAMPAVLAARPDARFVIVGDGPLRRELESLAGALRVREQAVFTGYVEDVAAHMEAFDVFVLTSQFAEGGVPLPVLEAMAMGKPVVVTDVVEIVEDGVNGLLVPKRDPTAVAERILRLLARPEEARALATRGREVARAHDAPAYARRLERVYDSLLA